MPEDDQYAITPLLNNPGIHSDRWGSLRIYQTAWNFATYINLSEFLQQTSILTKLCLELSARCYREDGTMCALDDQIAAMKETLEELGREQQEIENLIQGYQELHEDREKRAPLEFIGTIGQTLFGTLTVADAEFYDNHIEMLEDDTRSISELITNQTLLMKSQFNEQQIKQFNITNNFQLSYKLRREEHRKKGDLEYEGIYDEFKSPFVRSAATKEEIKERSLLNQQNWSVTGWYSHMLSIKHNT